MIHNLKSHNTCTTHKKFQVVRLIGKSLLIIIFDIRYIGIKMVLQIGMILNKFET